MAKGKQTLKTILGKAGIGKKDIAQIESNVKSALEEGESYSDEISKLKNVFTAYNKAGRDLNVLKEQNEQAYTSLNSMRGLGYFRDTKWGRNTTTRISNEPVQVVQEGKSEVKKHNPIEAKKEDSFLSAEAEENIDSNMLGRVTGAERGKMNMDAVAAFESEEGRALIDKTVAEEEKIAKQAQIRENVEKNIAETREAVAKDGRTKQVSGGSFDPYKSYLEKHKDSVSHVAHYNRVKQKADNFQAEYDTMVENGADEKAKIALARKYGINTKPGKNIQEAANAHFGKKLEADPSLWDKAVGHNVPQKATALGLTGGAVLAMANSRGQKSNAELYGV